MTISYPFFVYWGLNNFDISIIAIGGILVTIAQFSLRSLEAKKNFKTFLPLTVALVATYIAAYLLKSSAYMKFTPVLISANLLILFVSSLIKPPSMVERFAKIRFKDLPPEATPYCRNVTIIWILFFIVNGSIAFWTVFQDMKTWTFYNGFLAYILMGAIFGGEFLYRTIFIKKKSSFLVNLKNISAFITKELLSKIRLLPSYRKIDFVY